MVLVSPTHHPSLSWLRSKENKEMGIFSIWARDPWEERQYQLEEIYSFSLRWEIRKRVTWIESSPSTFTGTQKWPVEGKEKNPSSQFLPLPQVRGCLKKSHTKCPGGFHGGHPELLLGAQAYSGSKCGDSLKVWSPSKCLYNVKK